MIAAYLLELKRQLLFLAHGWQCALHTPTSSYPRALYHSAVQCR